MNEPAQEIPKGTSQLRLIWMLGAALVAVVLLPMLYFNGRTPKPVPNPDPRREEAVALGIKVEAIAENGAAARVSWHGVPVLHLEERVLSGARNGHQRGAAISTLWPLATSPKAAWAKLAAKLSAHDLALIEELHSQVLSNPSPMLSGGWLQDLVRETQTHTIDQSGDLQRLLLASDLASVIKVEALGFSTEIGPVITVEITSPAGLPLGEILTPLIYRALPGLGKDGKALAGEDKLAFMLGIYSHSAPLLGMNLDGLTLVRAPINGGPEDSIICPGGPDALTQLRVLLLGRQGASMAEGEIGPDLLFLSETQAISRFSTPAALLAADPHGIWRYEWSAVGASAERSGALEFTQLAQGETLAITDRFLSPEKRPKGAIEYRSPIAAQLSPKSVLSKMDTWVREAEGNSARLLLLPVDRRVIYKTGVGKLLELGLGQALGLRWEGAGTRPEAPSDK